MSFPGVSGPIFMVMYHPSHGIVKALNDIIKVASAKSLTHAKFLLLLVFLFCFVLICFGSQYFTLLSRLASDSYLSPPKC